MVMILYTGWFDLLKTSGHFINGFVIMPNHVHALISFTQTNQSIKTIIGNGKRFMAYEVINRLKQNNEIEVLSLLARNVEAFRRFKNKKHDV
jgi:REP element-mobilizing transposase RayT